MKTNFFTGRIVVLCSSLAAGLILEGCATTTASSGGEQALASPIATQQEAAALKPGSKVAMVCTKCKTVQIAEIDRKDGILGWFQPKTKHLCPGCGGQIEFTKAPVKGPKQARYVHTCSKCGSESVYCCAAESGQKTTGM